MASLSRSFPGALALACILALSGVNASAQEPPAATPPTQAAASAEAPAAADAATQAAPATAAKTGFGAWLASPSAYRPEMGLIFIANRDPEAGIATTPPILITNSFGFGLEYGLGGSGILRFVPGLAVYGSYYTLSAAGKAVPCPPEIRDVYLIGALLDLPFLLELRLGPGFNMAAGAGLAFHLRVGIKAAPDVGIQGDTSDDAAVLKTINLYYWSMGRFFLPSTILRFEYAAKEKLSFGLAFKAYWPVFNLWAGEDLGFFDQMILGAVITARFAR